MINEFYGSKLNRGTQFRNYNSQIVIIQTAADHLNPNLEYEYCWGTLYSYFYEEGFPLLQGIQTFETVNQGVKHHSLLISQFFFNWYQRTKNQKFCVNTTKQSGSHNYCFVNIVPTLPLYVLHRSIILNWPAFNKIFEGNFMTLDSFRST